MQSSLRPRKAASGVVRLLAVPLALGLPLACLSSRATGALDPRFVAVHNTLSSMGMAQVGPIQEGTLAEGRDVRVPLSLPAGCVTIVAIGADGIRDLDASLLDAHGAALAHDTTNEPQAVLRPCLEAADTYALVIKASSGAGAWVTATWAGGLGAAPSASSLATSAPAEANGTCQAPIPLAVGVVSGSTTRGEHENAGSCGPSDSRELVYELDVVQRERVAIEVDAHFDSVLYVRKDDCTDASAEVACNDDSGDRTRSRIERVLDPGKYFVFVDGYGHEAGSFKMTVEAAEVVGLSDACRRAPLLAAAATQTGTTASSSDEAHASCGGGALGADAVWQAEIATRARARIVQRSTEVAPVLHLRRVCAEEASEIACSESGAAPGEATVTALLDPGRYAVFADAHEQDATGRYSLLLETSPPAGTGAASDGCGDATFLPTGESGSVAGDTFAARDDIAGTCGGAGAADVVYRIDVPRRSRLAASLDGEEAPHLIDVFRRCGDRSTEVACGRSVDEIVAPGSYYVGVDGASPEAFGRFTLQWMIHDLSGQAAVCAQPPLLVAGRSIDATTVGAGDNFDATCAPTSDRARSGPDRVFRLVLTSPATVRLTLKATGFDAVLALRRACADVPANALGALSCEAQSDPSRHTTSIERSLEPGTYWVVVDGASAKDEGAFTLEYRVVR
jgi:hypothetical protein